MTSCGPANTRSWPAPNPHVLVEFRAIDDDTTEVRAHSVAGIAYGLQPVGQGMDELWAIVENCEDPLLGG